ncbi:MAG: hypothetical protein GX808_02850 [Syntrophomonadaceae bacterium]|nr:hypothetical protein [Syntrophomonadaceae bacterium]
MDKHNESDEKILYNGSQEEWEKMPSLAKKEQHKGLSLSSKKMNEISVRPKVKNGKILFDKNNKDHRYIVEADQ